MIIAAVSLSKFTQSGKPIMCPFGRGHDHGEAFKHLMQVYRVYNLGMDGFAATVDGKIVFLNREDAYVHAQKCNQLKEEYTASKGSLNSEMLAFFENGKDKELLEDMDYRMRDFYWMLKAKWKIDNAYHDLPKLSDEEKAKLTEAVVDTCDFIY